MTNGDFDLNRQAPQRPTNLTAPRSSSARPSRGRRRDNSPLANNNSDMDQLRGILLKKSGVLWYDSERIMATKEDFIDQGQLGSGTWGVVKKMQHKTRKELVMAVKQMHISSTSDNENKRIMMDLDVVTKCVGCPNIVKCLGIFFSTSEVWICMEVMSMSLDTLMKRIIGWFPEFVLGKIAVSIVKALDYLKRAHNMMHRDIKPSNMLLSYGGDIKLCDFGISGRLKDSIASSNQFGCIGYMAPERLDKISYDVRADIWSLGISLVELALKSFPYKNIGPLFAIFNQILHDPSPELPKDERFSACFRFFVNKCLKKDPKERPKYAELRQTELFLMYDRKPHDIGDWFRKVPLRTCDEYGGDEDRTPVSPASSIVTLSPDGNKSSHWLDGFGSESCSNVTVEDATRRENGGNVGKARNVSGDAFQSHQPVDGHVSSGVVNKTTGVTLRNRIPHGRSLSEAPSGKNVVDDRRKAFYPHRREENGRVNNLPIELDNTYHTPLQTYLNCLNQQSHKPSTTYYNTAPRASNSRSSILPPSDFSNCTSPTPIQRIIKELNIEGLSEYSPTSTIISSPRSQRSSSARRTGSVRRIQRTPACRYTRKPFQPTRVVNNDTSVFSFSPLTVEGIQPGDVEEATSSPEPQEYHHQFYWYAHQPSAQ